MPNLGKSTLNWLYVPPYKLEFETMLSPALAMVVRARNWAAWPVVAIKNQNMHVNMNKVIRVHIPDDTKVAAAPFSRAAIRFSTTSLVGFINLCHKIFLSKRIVEKTPNDLP